MLIKKEPQGDSGNPQEEMYCQAWSMILLSPHSELGPRHLQAHPGDRQPVEGSDASRRDGETSPSSASGPSQNRERQQWVLPPSVYPKQAVITCGRRGWAGKERMPEAGRSDNPVWPQGPERPGKVSVHVRRGHLLAWLLLFRQALSQLCETKNRGCRKSCFLSRRMFAPARVY